MRDKDSILLEQAYLKVVEKTVLTENDEQHGVVLRNKLSRKYISDPDEPNDYREYMEFVCDDFWNRVDGDEGLREQLVADAQAQSMSVPESASNFDIYKMLPRDCDACLEIEKLYDQTEEAALDAYRSAKDQEEHERSYRR